MSKLQFQRCSKGRLTRSSSKSETKLLIAGHKLSIHCGNRQFRISQRPLESLDNLVCRWNNIYLFSKLDNPDQSGYMVTLFCSKYIKDNILRSSLPKAKNTKTEYLPEFVMPAILKAPPHKFMTKHIVHYFSGQAKCVVTQENSASH